MKHETNFVTNERGEQVMTLDWMDGAVQLIINLTTKTMQYLRSGLTVKEGSCEGLTIAQLTAKTNEIDRAIGKYKRATEEYNRINRF